MPLDPSQAGRAYPPGPPYQVEREKIREFACAVGLTDPAHHDPVAARALGHPDVLAPPTFLCVPMQHATDQVVLDPELGLDYDRVVHRDQRFVLGRPVYAGDRLTLTVHIDAVKSPAGSDVLELRAEVAAADGTSVATVFMSLVTRAR
ncbi:MaoC family dehydratase N-terminal domain-containing protein [Streptomyces sp. NPDC092296]|uniref:FAS1-like dehydratase domain-containing protein n=1 Tax=Streptomyces sp. NPDC092296 TaxID=3366012 RepID=UPI003829F79D